MTSIISPTSSSPTSTFTPALNPPPDTTSNPDHPESLTHLSNLTIGICIPLVTIFFFLRTYTRFWVKRQSWILEDWITTAAWAGTVAYCGITSATMTHHGGKHGWDITAAEAQQAAYWFHVATIEYGITICITKLAVLWLYRRVFSPRRSSLFDITIVTLIVILIGFYGATTIVKIFQCSPRDKIFNRKLPGKCVNFSMVLNTSGSFNTITDFLILLLPVKTVWNLQMKKSKKLLVVLVFTFGLCAPVFSTIGFVARLKSSGHPDTTWNLPELLLWGAAELTTGNLCVCFPEMGLLFKRGGWTRHARPTPSILHGASEAAARSRKPNSGRDPYMTRALVDLNGSTVSAGGRYMDFDEDGMYGVHVTTAPPSSGSRLEKLSRNDAVHVTHELSVRSVGAV